MYSGGRITQDKAPDDDRIPIQASPAMYWNAEKQEWQLAGLCDACRQPFHGESKTVTVKVHTSPMVYEPVRLTVCEDTIACQRAFNELCNVNARLRSQGR